MRTLLALLILGIAGCGSPHSATPQPSRTPTTAPAPVASVTPTASKTRLPKTATASAPTSTPTSARTGPTATVYTNSKSHLTIRVERVIFQHGYALAQVSMTDSAALALQSLPEPPPFSATGFVSALSRPTLEGCDADSSRGLPLQYLSVPAHSTVSGWIRCDLPKTSTVMALFWQGNEVGGFRIPIAGGT